jgi:hypothetical protein
MAIRADSAASSLRTAPSFERLKNAAACPKFTYTAELAENGGLAIVMRLTLADRAKA